MAFLGLRKWSTPARLFLPYRPLHRADSEHIIQVAKPLWPFMVAGTLTMYLVAKAQDSGVKCAC